MARNYLLKIQKAIEKYHPLAVYLFGSRASNKATKNSDYDLLIITDNNTDPKKVCIEIGVDLFPREYSLDLLGYNLSQIEKNLVNNRFFQEIKKNGQLIYGKNII
ncbi:MAG: nucleotidyltransferase domain-containing protein [Candidatus Margulisiibacteriota bacterium]|jgi:predicted nucleotidyltransferase